MASRKSDGGAMSAELLQTLAEALRASSQAQQTMAEAMLALAGKPGTVKAPRSMAGTLGEADGEVFPHTGTLTWRDGELTFVEDSPGTMVESLSSLAGRGKKLRIRQLEVDLETVFGARTSNEQVALVFGALETFVENQQGFKILSDATCPQQSNHE